MGSVSDRSNPRYFMTLACCVPVRFMAAFRPPPASSRRRVRLVWVIAATQVAERLYRAWMAAVRQDHVHWFISTERGLTVSDGIPRTTSAGRWWRVWRSRAFFCPRLARQFFFLLQRIHRRGGAVGV